MHVCLSSGTRPRYRRDIIRVLAMAAGTWVQFRYDNDWVAPSLLKSLRDPKALKAIRGMRTLIAYVDQTDAQRDPEPLPCRMATLVDAVALGRTVSLQLELEEFAFASNVGRFGNEVAD